MKDFLFTGFASLIAEWLTPQELDKVEDALVQASDGVVHTEDED